MCGRFLASKSPEEVARRFETRNPVPNAPPRYNAAPSQDLLVVRFNPATGERQLDALRWGLVPYWAKDAQLGHSLINSRAEAIAEKAAFREAFKARRCIVPADGFYEWQAIPGGKEKQPYCIAMKDRGVFGFAGLWERWRDKASGEVVRSFAIVTTTPNKVSSPIHDRMPAILDPADYGGWLGEEPAEPARLLAMLKPFPAEAMEAFPIGKRVGNVRNDDASLIEPLAAAS